MTEKERAKAIQDMLELSNLVENKNAMCISIEYKTFIQFLQIIIDEVIYIYKETGIETYQSNPLTWGDDGDLERISLLIGPLSKLAKKESAMAIIKRKPFPDNEFGLTLIDDNHYTTLVASPSVIVDVAKVISEEMLKYFDSMSDEDKCLMILNGMNEIQDIFKNIY